MKKIFFLLLILILTTACAKGEKGDKGDSIIGPPGQDGKEGEIIVVETPKSKMIVIEVTRKGNTCEVKLGELE